VRRSTPQQIWLAGGPAAGAPSPNARGLEKARAVSAGSARTHARPLVILSETALITRCASGAAPSAFRMRQFRRQSPLLSSDPASCQAIVSLPAPGLSMPMMAPVLRALRAGRRRFVASHGVPASAADDYG
jgi:hypothetical protein